MDLEKFGAAAKGLAKNPLGIIALFIVLVYGIAGLVLGTTAKSLSTDQKTVLVWFLFLFPFAVLAAFTWLVAKHPRNLYAPSDYRTDEAYLQSLDPARQIERLEEAVAEASAEMALEVAERDHKAIRGGESPSHEELVRDVVLSEDLALREIQTEYGSSLRRQVAVGEAALDAMFAAGGRGYGVEVKYVTGRLQMASIMRQLEALAVEFRRLGWRNFEVILALVLAPSAGDIESRLPEIRSFAERVGIDLEVRVYRFDELRQKYGL